MPLLPLSCLVAAGFVVAVFGGRSMVAIHASMRRTELSELVAPLHWHWARGFLGLCAAMASFALCNAMNVDAMIPAGLTLLAVYAAAPGLLAATRRRLQLEVRDELPLHVDLMALGMEAGCSLSAALALCAQHAPDGALRRAWPRVLREIHAGVPMMDALKALEQRIDVPTFSSLLVTLRNAERSGADLPPLLRERALQLATQRFTRAERLARAAPLKLWAAMVLCLVPGAFVVLAFPLAGLLVHGLA